jgi:hypothetical protein
VDHDSGVEPKPGDETIGVGEEVGIQAPESDPFFFDQLTGSSD